MITFTVSGAPGAFDAEIRFLGATVGGEDLAAAREAAAGQSDAEIEIVYSGATSLRALIDAFDFDAAAAPLDPSFAASDNLTLATARARDGGDASATASDDGAAEAVAEGDGSEATSSATSDATATSLATSGGVAAAEASDASTASATAASGAGATALASLSANATAIASAGATAFADANDASDAQASAAGANGSAEATATISSEATATATNESAAQANAANVSAAVAVADGSSSDAEAAAADGSEATATAESASVAKSDAADGSLTLADARNAGMAVAAADLQSAAKADADLAASAEARANAGLATPAGAAPIAVVAEATLGHSATVIGEDGTLGPFDVATALFPLDDVTSRPPWFVSPDGTGFQSGFNELPIDFAAEAQDFSYTFFEDAFQRLDLGFRADRDASSVQQVVLSGLPVGTILTAGTPSADGAVWTFEGVPPEQLFIRLPLGNVGMQEIALDVTDTKGTIALTNVLNIQPFSETALPVVNIGATPDFPLSTPTPEGQTVPVRVSLEVPALEDIAVTVRSQDSGAFLAASIADVDYEAAGFTIGPNDTGEIVATKTVSIPKGEQFVDILLPLILDTDAANDAPVERGVLEITDADRARVGDGSASFFIDDVPNTVGLSLSLSPTSISEAGGIATGTLTRDGATDGDLIVSLTSDDPGEAIVPGSVTIQDGAESVTFTVTAQDDALIDGTQTASISASAAGFVGAAAAIVVLDDETPLLTITLDQDAISENGGAATATVTRTSGDISSPLTVTLSSSDESAATLPATVTIAANAAAASVTVTAEDDMLVDGTQTTTLTATAEGFTAGTVALDVTDDEEPALFLTPDTTEIDETAGVVTFTLSRDSAADAVTVSFAANSPDDLVAPADLDLAAGVSEAQVAFSVVDDTLVEGLETVSVTAFSEGFSEASATVSIIDDDMTVAAPMAVDDPGEGVISVLEDAGATPIDILANDDTSGLAEVVASDGSIGTVIFDGSVVQYTPNAEQNGPDSFTYTLVSTEGAESTATVVLTVQAVNDAPQLTLLAGNQSVVAGSGPQTIDSFATGSTGPANEAGQTLSFLLETSDDTLFDILPAIDAESGALSFTPAANVSGTASVTVIAVDDGGVANGGGDQSAAQVFSITIDPEPPIPTLTLSVDPAEISESGGAATATLTRTGSTEAALLVSLLSSDETEATTPVEVLIPAGQASTTFAVTAGDDDLVDGTQTTTIAASADGFIGASATLDVLDDDAPTTDPALEIGIFDAATHALLATLGEATVIEASVLAGREVTISATIPTNSVFFGTVESMALSFNGDQENRVENVEPYTLFGDFPAGDFNGQEDAIPLGPNSISFELYSQNGATGDLLGTVTRGFTVVEDNQVNDPPVAVDDAARIRDGETQITIKPLENDFDPDEFDQFSIAAVIAPEGVSAVISEDATEIDVTVEDGFAGSATLTYTIQDEQGAVSNPAEITLTQIAAGGLEVFLADATTDTELATIQEGETLSVESLGVALDELSILARPTEDGPLSAAESVFLSLNGGEKTRTENVEPYALFGDNPNTGDIFQGAGLTIGQNTVMFSVYEQNNLGGELLGEIEISFTLIEDALV